jgi:hypothetical protein
MLSEAILLLFVHEMFYGLKSQRVIPLLINIECICGDFPGLTTNPLLSRPNLVSQNSKFQCLQLVLRH